MTAREWRTIAALLGFGLGFALVQIHVSRAERDEALTFAAEVVVRSERLVEACRAAMNDALDQDECSCISGGPL